MDKEKIREINQHIKDGVKQWSDIMLMADADEWASDLHYGPNDILNSIVIF